MMLDAPGFPVCTCDYMYVWRYSGPKRIMQERDSVLSHYHHDCPVPSHSALAAVLEQNN